MTLPATAAAKREAKARRSTKRRNLAIRIGSVAALLLVWEICGMLTPRIFLSPFHDSVTAFWRLATDGTLLAATSSSLLVFCAGLGGLVIRHASSFRTAEMFVPIFVLVALGYGLTALVLLMQERIAPWKETERDLGA